jgi:murein DD-endopeptidase MepM/ murein hydrolase activator NlpD
VLITPPPFCIEYKGSVIKRCFRAALAAFFMGMGALPSFAQQTSQAALEEERLLGRADEDDAARELLPFTRSLGASGIVTGSLADSIAAAGVPRAALLQAMSAFTSVGEVQDGDSFYVRWEQTYTVDGNPIGVGRVLWLEVRGSGGTVALHRFRPRAGGESFFLAGGEAATRPALAVPVDDANVSSPFGLRHDPLRRGVGPVTRGHRAFAGFGPRFFMHEGVDFAVPQGTPVYAAADGVVKDAKPNGGYGNYVRLEHDDGVATAYGHLSRFAPGLKPGKQVTRGELVGFSGNTGRSTGPHLHFEVLTDGKPVDPLVHAAIDQLAGPDLDAFEKKVEADQRERQSEAQAGEL